MTRVQQKICQKNLIAAYVDGELSEVATAIFEQHVEECEHCRTDLRAHRIFVCELDAALTANTNFPSPADEFSKVIATRARSDMRGVRSAAEHRKAIAICMILALTGFGLLSATARDNVFVVIGRFVGGVFSVIGFVAGVTYDAVAGLVVITRVLGQKIVNERGSFAVVLVVLGAGVVLLTRLIHDYHRTGATE
jgi:anti-sigma factor RsiW